jgi:GNAT superfamily N-acetyltransferase
VQYDARRLGHGVALVDKLRQAARERNCTLISLWCAASLEANEFWKALGFTYAGTKEGGRRRGTQLNHWVMPADASQIVLF